MATRGEINECISISQPNHIYIDLVWFGLVPADFTHIFQDYFNGNSKQTAAILLWPQCVKSAQVNVNLIL